MKKLIFIVILALFLPGCVQKETVELTFRITWDVDSGRGRAILNLVEDFNELHNDINVTMIGGTENKSIYKTQIEEDIVDIYVLPYRYLHNDIISSELINLENEMPKLVDAQYSSMIDLATYDDELKGIPWIGHSMALIYNKRIMNQVNVDPTSWSTLDDLLVASKTINEELQIGGLGLVGAEHHDLSWMIPQFIYSFGGNLVELDDDGKFKNYTINSKEAIDALDFYINELSVYAQEGWENDSGIEVLELFKNEEIAMEIQGPWGVTDIWKLNEPFEVGVIPLSQIGMHSDVGPLMMSISKDTEYVMESVEFIEYMNSLSSLNKLMAGEYIPKYDAYYPFRIPIREDMVDSSFFVQYPEFYAFIQGFDQPSISTPCTEWEEIQDGLFVENIHSAIIGEVTIEEALGDLQ